MISFCKAGYVGDPFRGCSLPPPPPPPEVKVEPSNPCYPSPCGPNARCQERNGAGACTCLPEYFGNPYTGCYPECVTDNDCSLEKACTQSKCRDPCPGTNSTSTLQHDYLHSISTKHKQYLYLSITFIPFYPQVFADTKPFVQFGLMLPSGTYSSTFTSYSQFPIL